MLNKRCLLLFVSSIFPLCHSFAENVMAKGWGVELSEYFLSPYGKYIVTVDGLRYWELNKYIAMSAEAQIVTADMSKLGWWYENGNRYCFDDEEPQISIDLSFGFRINIPLSKNIGFCVGLNGAISLIPYDFVQIKKFRNDIPLNYDRINLHGYNCFSPKVLGGIGLYHDIVEAEDRCRIAIEYRYGWVNELNGIRDVNYQGVRLGDHIPSNDFLHNLTIKLIIIR